MATHSIDATECKPWETCLQAEFKFQLSLEDGANGRPRIHSGGGQIIRHDDDFGTMCGGAINVIGLDFFNDSASHTQIFDNLKQRQRDNTPPLVGEGAELGSFATYQRDRIIAIKTQLPSQDDGFRDDFGIIRNVVPNP
ncbi:MAG: hypothetical protein HY287_06060 [Planctomycetes bacterium]|nr:hypothetical protein [Planctomycetota bacterium]MBI3833877.1 hypothetical protein [Planctomycetota bacterium]